MTTSLPEDTLFGRQWHLRNTGQYGGTPGIDINVAEVWADYTGQGVAIGVLDTGVDAAHPDLRANYDAAKHVPFDGFDGSLQPTEAHGTAVAGLIAAARNGVGTVGVAYDARITALPGIVSEPLVPWDPSNLAYITKLATAQSAFDVVNHSWGFTVPFEDQAVPDTFWAGIAAAAAEGRGGLGTVMVAAAGNYRREMPQSASRANMSEFAGDPHLIVVGATDDRGGVAVYSSAGANLLVSAAVQTRTFTVGTVSTDIHGADGLTAGNYTTRLNGTSAAAPLVSGVAALMLEANPALGWRDVAEILAYSARHTGSAIGAAPAGFETDRWVINGATGWNGGGLHFSNDYGFGRVDALAAVRLAETWTGQSTTDNLLSVEVRGKAASVVREIPDAAPRGLVVQFEVSAPLDVERVQLQLSGLTHSRASDLTITLTSPDGTVSTLFDHFVVADAANDVLSRPRFTSNAFYGEAAAGTWTLRIVDSVAGFSGKLVEPRLTLLGSAASDDDLYVYTDAYAGLAAAGGRGLLGDAAGNDTINAAAVAGDVAIDLRPGAGGTIAGAAFGIAAGTVVERVYAGDGDDALTGNAVANLLYGGRGDDLLAGGAGGDTLDGGAGYDVALYRGGVVLDLLAGAVSTREAAGDVLVGIERIVLSGDRSDVARGAGGADVLDGRGGDDTLAGRGGDDRLLGGLGDDVLDGGAGDDILVGGAGRDRLSGGDGADIFRLDAAMGADDLISDFVSRIDRLQLLAADLPGFTAGAGLTLGAAATGSAAQFVYDGASGRLSWDGDGAGDGGALLLATLAPDTLLTRSDLWVL